jgi:glycosyltransferase involved in cell wall biosynthesis
VLVPKPHADTARDVFSAIVPTWNEAGWLPALLRRLRVCPQIGEIIVADNGSTDQTTVIADAFECTVIPGGTPAAGRNAGARAAIYPLLLFVDADAVFSSRHVEIACAMLSRPAVVGMHFRLVPLGGTGFVRLCYSAMARYLALCSRFGIAQGTGSFVAVRREAFETVGGFDEGITAGEDADFVRRLGATGSVIYSTEPPVLTSARRFDIELPVLFAAKTCLWAALRLMRLRSSLIPYSWRHYPLDLAARDEELAAALDRT